MGLLRRSNPYAARSEEEWKRNNARLGTQWQARELTEREHQWQQAMRVWEARDAHDALLPMLGLVLLGLLAVGIVVARGLEQVAHWLGW